MLLARFLPSSFAAAFWMGLVLLALSPLLAVLSPLYAIAVAIAFIATVVERMR